MINLLKAKGTYFVAFLLAFLLMGNVTMAQEEPAFFEEFDDTEWALDDEWEAQTFIDDTWDDSGWADEGFLDWSYGTDTTITPSDLTTEDAAVLAAIMGVWGIIMLIVLAPMYIYLALTLMTTAKKLGISSAWFAWVPVLNLVLLCRCAGITSWFFLAFFVPLINIIIGIYAYMKIAERRGFESWLGILMIVPVANIIIPGYLAWGEPPKKGE